MNAILCLLILSLGYAIAVTDFRPKDDSDGLARVEANEPLNVHIVFSNHLVRKILNSSTRSV